MLDEVAFRQLVSGRRRGPIAAAKRCGLALMSLGYGLAARANGWAYDLGIKTAHRVRVPVVSIGNLTTGGTGKTPFVAHVANAFRTRGLRPAILSRGYRSGADGTNDEKRVLDALCHGVPHFQNRDRVAGAHAAIESRDANVLVLDDGFQHRRLHRDLDIVLVDALEPWGYGHLLPRGLLREPRAALRRADVVVITRVDQCADAERAALVRDVERWSSGAAVVEAAFPPRILVNDEGRTASIDLARGAPVTAFCGIGNPSGFRAALGDLGVEVAAFDEYPDHHHFGPRDVEVLRARAAEHRVPLVLCTEKDLVKVREQNLGDAPLWAVRIGVAIRRGGERLDDSLSRIAAAATGAETTRSGQDTRQG